MSKLDCALVFGSNGGIGSSIFKTLKEKKYYQKVYGFSRDHTPKFDITSDKEIKNLSEKILDNDLNIKLIVNAIGFLHDEKYFPEKKAEEINQDYMKKSFEVNSIFTALLIKYFAPIMPKVETSIFASLSARVGSISDNYLGGWYSYRASKAALNQIMKTASVEYKRKNKNIIFISIHPGTVATKLSKPFSEKKSLFSTDQAALKIIDLFDNLTIENSGQLIDYKKEVIPF